MGPFYTPDKFFVIAPKLNQKRFVCWSVDELLICLDIFDAWQKLARPDYDHDAKNIANRALPPESSNIKNHSALDTINASLLALPYELLSEICSQLPREDILSLGATCGKMLQYVAGYIEDDIRSTAAPWAGQPLALGRQCWVSIPEEYGEIVNTQNEKMAEISLQWYPSRKVGVEALLNDMWAVPEPPEDRLRTWAVLLQKCSEKYDLHPYAVTLIRESLLRPGLKADAEMQCYLRNISKKQFIRCKCNPASFGGLVMTGRSSIPSISLDTVLCTLIQCGYKSNGSWAGDCFDIVTSRMHTAYDGDDGAWIDVTDVSVTNIMATMTRPRKPKHKNLPAFIADTFGNMYWACPPPDLKTGYNMYFLGTPDGRFEKSDDQIVRQFQPPYKKPVDPSSNRKEKTSKFPSKRIVGFLRDLSKGKGRA